MLNLYRIAATKKDKANRNGNLDKKILLGSVEEKR